MLARLCIIGAGRVGQTLAYLWQAQNALQMSSVYCRSMARAQAAVDFIGAGVACADLAEIVPADYYMLSVPDDAIESVAIALSQQTHLWQQASIVFHCSGALSSSALQVLQSAQCQVASVHPVNSLADPTLAIHRFAGTYCSVEGASAVQAPLCALLQSIAAHPFKLSTKQKTLYHAATVLACNHLVGLLQVAVDVYGQAGIDDQQALAMLQPIVTQTVDNVFALGLPNALTGPVARGDVNTVQQHLQQLKSHAQAKKVYQALLPSLLGLATRSQQLPDALLAALSEVCSG